MIDRALAEKIDAMLRAVAPELDCYVLDMASIPNHGSNDNSCLGWALQDMWFDLGIRQAMGELYRGPKQFFALDIPAIQEVAKPGHFERCILNIALHEAAHLLPAHEVFELPDVPRTREFQAAAFATAWNEGAKSECSTADGGGHDLRFVRRCCHLYSRAIAAEYDPAGDFLFGMRGCGWQSWADKYVEALGDEPASMATAKFCEIEASEPPAAFSNLWAADVAKYKHYQEREIDRPE